MIVPHVPKKAQKITRALKTAAKLPARVSGGRGSGRNHLSPSPGESPVAILRLQVIGCRDLAPRAKNASCDPCVSSILCLHMSTLNAYCSLVSSSSPFSTRAIRHP